MAFKSRLKCLFLKPIFCILFATFLHFARNTTLAYYQQFLNEITGKKEFNTGRGIGALKKDESINYFKLKTSPLGVRFNTEKNQWTGPVGYENAFKIIKKEAFTWKITV